MIVIVMYVIFSFLLDSFVSNIISFEITNPSYLKTIYSVISLVIIYNYFDNKNKYIVILVLLGVFFDIVYTNTFILNIVVFFVIYIILSWLDYIIPNNILMINIKALICIFCYYILTYIILVLANYNIYSIKLLENILVNNIIMSVIYTSISYIIMNKIMDNKRIR